MALIEGVGDEVTLLFSALLLILVLLLAWISTRTSDPPEHLFASAPGPSPSAQQEASSSLPSGSVNGSPLTDAAATDASRQEEKDEGGGTGGAAGGEGLRPRDGGGGGGGLGESSSSQRSMVVRLKFLNDTERTAQVQPQDTVGYLKR